MNQRSEQARMKWQNLISEQARSGQGVIDFCRERGVSDRQFFHWQRWLRATGTPQFMEVQIAKRGVPQRAATDGSIEVRLRNGRSLVVAPEFDARHLRALLAVLESES